MNKDKSAPKSQLPVEKIIECVMLLISLGVSFLYEYVKWYVVLIVFALFVVGVLILYYLNNKNRIKSINDEIDLLKDVTQDIKELSSYPSLLEHVCGSRELMKIEGSVGDNEFDGHRIYLQSSKFELESDEKFSHMLINNLRKGVQYHYLIPYSNNKLDYRQFYEMVIGWWVEYSRFIADKNCCNELIRNKNPNWQKKYLRILNTASVYWNNKGTESAKWDKLIDDLYSLFKKRLYVYTANQSIFYIVTAIYQVGPNMWKAIIKLPTEYGNDSNDDYYTFVVFGNTYTDSNNPFITKFRHNFKDKNLFDMKDLYDELDERVGELKNGKHEAKS